MRVLTTATSVPPPYVHPCSSESAPFPPCCLSHKEWRLMMGHALSADQDEHRGRHRSENLDPLLFHVVNVLVHGLVSVLVSR